MMRRRTSLVVICLLSASQMLAQAPIAANRSLRRIASPESRRQRPSTTQTDKEEMDGPRTIEERIRLYKQRHGEIDPEVRLRLTRDDYTRREREKTLRASGRLVDEQPTWVSIGPTNGAGRMTAITPHPTEIGTLYAGADGGGAWKTTDGGNTWVCLTDSLNNLHVGAIAIAPSLPNTVYLGTGFEGIGVLKSLDGGSTWIFPNGRVPFSEVNRISIHPTNANELVVATSNGAFQSDDGGFHWNRVIAGSSYGEVSDLVRDPKDTRIFYAATNSWWLTSPAPILLKSIDEGQTWQQSSRGLPVTTENELIIRPSLAISGSDPRILFLSFSIFNRTSGTNVSHVYKTIDAGQSWADLMAVSGDPTMNFLDGQAWHDNTIVVSPTDPNTVIAGGVFYIRSTDGGTTWTRAFPNGSPHADATDMRYQGRILYIANDGGIWSSADDGLASTDHNNGLVTREYYAMAIDQNNRDRVVAGSQDNGTNMRFDSGSEWKQILCCDGFDCAINPYVSSIWYATYQDGHILRYREAGSPSTFSTTQVTPPFAKDESGSFYTPLLMDPNNPWILYTGSNEREWKSTDGGDSWIPFPSDGPRIKAVAPGNSSIILATQWFPNEAKVAVMRSTDGGVSWSRSASPSPFLAIDDLEFDPRDLNRVYGVDRGSSIFASTDDGATWSARGSGLPVALTLAIDPNDTDVLYCGTRMGVYRSTDRGFTWSRFGVGLPSVWVEDLQILSDGSILRAATYGRGVWEIHVPTSNTPPKAAIVSPSSPTTVSAAAPITFQGVISDLDAGDSVKGQWLFTDTSEVVPAGLGSTTVSHTFMQAGSYYVVLTARDSHGSLASASLSLSVRGPLISSALISKANLVIFGDNFDNGATIVMDGQPQPTKKNKSDPKHSVISKGLASQIASGQTVILRVQNPSRAISPPFRFTRP